MKSLSSMSAVAKRNLSSLAMQFSKHSGERGEPEERGRLVEDQGVSGCDVCCCVCKGLCVSACVGAYVCGVWVLYLVLSH